MDSKRLAYIVAAAVIGTLIFVAVYHINTGNFKLFASSGEEVTKPNEEAPKGGENTSATD